MPKDNTPFKVQIRKGFFDRSFRQPTGSRLQLGELDERTRISLLNAINWLYDAAFHRISSVAVASGGTSSEFWVQVLREVYGKPVSYSSSKGNDEVKMLKIVGNTLLHDDCDHVLTLVEYLAAQFAEKDRYLEFLHPYELFNSVFEKEYVGYRFVGGSLVQITDENEMREIAEASQTGLAAVDVHMEKAIGLLSNRNIPDYERSARESFLAVEAMCRTVLEKVAKAGAEADASEPAAAASLAETLQMLKACPDVQPAFVNAFEALAGFVPLITEDADVSFEESRFLLVACAGFINYLKGVMSHGESSRWPAY